MFELWNHLHGLTQFIFMAIAVLAVLFLMLFVQHFFTTELAWAKRARRKLWVLPCGAIVCGAVWVIYDVMVVLIYGGPR